MVVPVFLNGGSLRPLSANIAFLLQRSKLNPRLAGNSTQDFVIFSSLIGSEILTLRLNWVSSQFIVSEREFFLSCFSERPFFRWVWVFRVLQETSLCLSLSFFHFIVYFNRMGSALERFEIF